MDAERLITLTRRMAALKRALAPWTSRLPLLALLLYYSYARLWPAWTSGKLEIDVVTAFLYGFLLREFLITPQQREPAPVRPSYLAPPSLDDMLRLREKRAELEQLASQAK